MMGYSFDIYKKEHLRYSWLSGRYSDGELKERFFEDYRRFCAEHGLEPCEEVTNEQKLDGRRIASGI